MQLLPSRTPFFFGLLQEREGELRRPGERCTPGRPRASSKATPPKGHRPCLSSDRGLLPAGVARTRLLLILYSAQVMEAACGWGPGWKAGWQGWIAAAASVSGGGGPRAGPEQEPSFLKGKPPAPQPVVELGLGLVGSASPALQVALAGHDRLGLPRHLHCRRRARGVATLVRRLYEIPETQALPPKMHLQRRALQRGRQSQPCHFLKGGGGGALELRARPESSVHDPEQGRRPPPELPRHDVRNGAFEAPTTAAATCSSRTPQHTLHPPSGPARPRRRRQAAQRRPPGCPHAAGPCCLSSCRHRATPVPGLAFVMPALLPARQCVQGATIHTPGARPGVALPAQRRGWEWLGQLSGRAGSGSASSAGGPRARPPLGPPNPAHQAFKVLNGLLDVIQSVSLVLKLLRELAARLWPIRQLLHRGLLGSHSAVGPKGGLCGSRPGRCTACMRVRRSIVG